MRLASFVFMAAGLMSLGAGPDFCPVPTDRYFALLPGSGGFLAPSPVSFRDQERRAIVVKYHPGTISTSEELYSQYDLVTKEGFTAVFSPADNGLAIVAPIDSPAPVDRNVFPFPTATSTVWECHVFEMQYSKATGTLVSQNDRVRLYRAQDSEVATTRILGTRKGIFGTKVRRTATPFSVGMRSDQSNPFSGKIWEVLVIDDVVTQGECDEIIGILKNNDPTTSFSLHRSIRHHWSFGDAGGDSSDSASGGKVRDRVGNLHLSAIGLSPTVLLRD